MQLKPDEYTALDPQASQGYGLQELPSLKDETIRNFLDSIRGRSTFADAVGVQPPESWEVLSVFAERAASLAVRNRDESFLRAGLTASQLAFMTTSDEREVLPSLSLLYRAAEMIGVDASAAFRSVAEHADDLNGPLVAFLGRNAEDRSIEVMGYEESGNESRFIFRRTW